MTGGAIKGAKNPRPYGYRSVGPTSGRESVTTAPLEIEADESPVAIYRQGSVLSTGFDRVRVSQDNKQVRSLLENISYDAYQHAS